MAGPNALVQYQCENCAGCWYIDLAAHRAPGARQVACPWCSSQWRVAPTPFEDIPSFRLYTVVSPTPRSAP
jgi:hypothetical protein